MPANSREQFYGQQQQSKPGMTVMDEADRNLQQQISREHIFFRKYDPNEPHLAELKSYAESVDRHTT
jgi:hypothetical protein